MESPTEQAVPSSQLVDMARSASLSCSSQREDSPVSHVLRADASFWQSDGTLPHWLQASWPRPVALCVLRLALNPGRDESYTPARVVVLGGDDALHLVEVAAADVPEEYADGRDDASASSASPGGAPVFEVDLAEANDGAPVAVRVVRVVVLANYANGKDCRVHGVALLARRPAAQPDGLAIV